MAETKAAAAAKPEREEYEEIYVPRGNANDDPNLMIGVNGVNYVLPKGQRHRVPKHVAYEFNRAEAAIETMYLNSKAMAAK